MTDEEAGGNAEIGPQDEAAVRALFARLYKAWEDGDGAGYGRCFAERSDYITFNGMHLRGRTENTALHGALFRGVLKGTKLSAEIRSIELLSSNVALVHTEGGGRKKSYQTYVLVKRGADWLIRSFQNTRVQPLSIWITRWAQRRTSR
jgi:uncharacterized protein (TIGR02246 family)